MKAQSSKNFIAKWFLATACAIGAGAAQAQEFKTLDFPVTYEEFSQWPDAKKRAYDKEMTAAYSEFELASQEGMKFDDGTTASFWFNILPKAFAADAVGKACLIGGIRRNMILDPATSIYRCPTDKRSCGSHADGGYLCGTIYNDACIPKLPSKTITSRCIQAAGNFLPSQNRYNEKREAIASVAQECRDGVVDERYKKQCAHFMARMDRLNNGASEIAVDPKKITVETVDTKPAPAAVTETAPAVDTTPDASAEVAVTTGDDPAPRVRGTRRNADAKPAVRESAPASNDCINRNRAKLGSLACVACGMETAAPADIRNHGGGVDKWVALVGVMAQRSYGPYNVNDEVSRQNFQERVAEMVSAYGYCTNREYPAEPGNATRDLIDGRKMTKADQSTFVAEFGLMSDKRGLGTALQKNFQPMTYADECFKQRPAGFNGGSVHARQWRFRSKVKAHVRSFGKTPFGQCGAALEKRMAGNSYFRMCNIRERKKGKQLKIEFPSNMTGDEIAKNDGFYNAVASACGFKKKRKHNNSSCDHGCWGKGAYSTSADIQYCRLKRTAPGGDGSDDPKGKPGEKENDRPSDPGDPGKGGERESSRSNDGPSDPGKSSENSGDRGSDRGNDNGGGSPGGDNGGKSGESSSAR